MAGNTFGHLFKITTFGESHGDAIGVIIDGCPAGLVIHQEDIQQELNRRKPGQSNITTSRNEDDIVKILSGVFENTTTGTPICLMIENKNAKSADYSQIKNTFRPSHADYTYTEKYGIRDYRGGGRASARETAARVAAGAVAKKLLQYFGISVIAYVSAIHNIAINTPYKQLNLNNVESNIVRCPDLSIANKMIALIEKTKNEGDSLGGTVAAVIKNCPVGLGEPVFDKLQAVLAHAMLSINAVHGFEYGSGFNATTMKGSEHNDIFENKDGKIVTKTNFSGGIQGGISNGMDIYFKVAFKPTATIMQSQSSIDKEGNEIILEAKGRHDPCVVPRAVPIVEAMAALVLVDYLLLNKVSQLKYI